MYRRNLAFRLPALMDKAIHRSDKCQIRGRKKRKLRGSRRTVMRKTERAESPGHSRYFSGFPVDRRNKNIGVRGLKTADMVIHQGSRFDKDCVQTHSTIPCCCKRSLRG